MKILRNRQKEKGGEESNKYFYAVARGSTFPAIYHLKENEYNSIVRKLVDGVSRNKNKRFNTLEDAKKYMEENGVNESLTSCRSVRTCSGRCLSVN